MAIAYPEGLPYPLRDAGYGFDPVSPLVSTQLQSGQSISRRGFKNTPTDASVTWEMDDGQARLFENWFENALVSGSLPFDCPLKTPMGIDNYFGKFNGMYQGPVLVGISRWRFQAKIRLFKRPMLDKDWLLMPDYVLHADIFDKAINLEKPEVIAAPTTQRIVDGGEVRVVDGLEERVV